MSARLIRQARLLRPEQLVAKLYFNRSLNEIRRKEYAIALADAEMAGRLDPEHTEVLESTRTIWNNWSLAALDQGDFRRALSLIRQGQDSFPNDALLRANELHLYLCWLQHHVEQRDVSGFNAVLNHAIDRFPTRRVFRDLRAKDRSVGH